MMKYAALVLLAALAALPVQAADLLLSGTGSVLAVSSSSFTIAGGWAQSGSTRYTAPDGSTAVDGGSGTDFLLTDAQPTDFAYAGGTASLSPVGLLRRRGAIARAQAALIGALPNQMTIENMAPFSWQGTLAAPHSWSIADPTHDTIARIALAAHVSLSDPGSFPWPANFSLPDATGAPVALTAAQTEAFSYAVFTLIWNRTHFGTITLAGLIAALTPANDGEVAAKFNAAVTFDLTAGWPAS